MLNAIVAPSEQHSWKFDEEIIELDSKFLMTTMMFALIWLICSCISAVTCNVEAFRGMLQRKLKPVLNPLQFINSRNNNDDSTRTFDSVLSDLGAPFALVDDIPMMAAEEEYANTHIHSPDVTHFCFLIHGHRGLSKDLRYMETAMQRVASAEKRRQWEAFSLSSADLGEDSSGSLSSSSSSTDRDQLTNDMVVHSSICNEHKTTDGVQKGGDRLVEEMRQVIETEISRRYPEPSEDEIYDVTISVLGNSLGGLFGRYAIAKLVERHCVKESESEDEDICWILDGKYRLHLNIFCTTATPHLGVSRHTYVRIPRSAEIGVAHAMGDTGKDLFRLNDLLHTMATCPNFLGPLARFRKRICYANAYGTDFPVPAGTAAFLSENSTYPHHFETDELMVDDRGLIIATLNTPTQTNETKNSTEVADGTSDDSTSDTQSGDHDDELHHMSRSLDKLGWKKVFVDVRREIPSVELPKSFMMRRQSSDSRLVAVDANLHALKSKKIVQSKDVATAVALQADNRVSLPLGHNMMVAFSRSRISTFMNKGGRPVVDALAKELVEDIFSSWNGTRVDIPSSII
jgi:hypothetical protein